jgi:hypothetical protein
MVQDGCTPTDLWMTSANNIGNNWKLSRVRRVVAKHGLPLMIANLTRHPDIGLMMLLQLLKLQMKMGADGRGYFKECICSELEGITWSFEWSGWCKSWEYLDNGTMLQAGRSWIQFTIKSYFSVDIILSTALLALGSTQPLTEMSTRNLPGGKGQPVCEFDNLTYICELIV